MKHVFIPCVLSMPGFRHFDARRWLVPRRVFLYYVRRLILHAEAR